jgi:hypothetical protein
MSITLHCACTLQVDTVVTCAVCCSTGLILVMLAQQHCNPLPQRTVTVGGAHVRQGQS